MKDLKRALALQDAEFETQRIEIEGIERRGGEFGLVRIVQLKGVMHVWLSAKNCRRAAKKLKQIAKWIEEKGGV